MGAASLIAALEVAEISARSVESKPKIMSTCEALYVAAPETRSLPTNS